jgi:hypothetical protein
MSLGYRSLHPEVSTPAVLETKPLSLALQAIETALKKSPFQSSYNQYTFYTCIRYTEYNNTQHIACVKGIYKTHALNVFFASVDTYGKHDSILKKRFNGIIYEYPPKSDL